MKGKRAVNHAGSSFTFVEDENILSTRSRRLVDGTDTSENIRLEC